MAFNLRELLEDASPNTRGAPRSLSPHETRIRGPLLLLILALALVAILLLMSLAASL